MLYVPDDFFVDHSQGQWSCVLIFMFLGSFLIYNPCIFFFFLWGRLALSYHLCPSSSILCGTPATAWPDKQCHVCTQDPKWQTWGRCSRTCKLNPWATGPTPGLFPIFIVLMHIVLYERRVHDLQCFPFIWPQTPFWRNRFVMLWGTVGVVETLLIWNLGDGTLSLWFTAN